MEILRVPKAMFAKRRCIRIMFNAQTLPILYRQSISNKASMLCQHPLSFVQSTNKGGEDNWHKGQHSNWWSAMPVLSYYVHARVKVIAPGTFWCCPKVSDKVPIPIQVRPKTM